MKFEKIDLYGVSCILGVVGLTVLGVGTLTSLKKIIIGYQTLLLATYLAIVTGVSLIPLWTLGIVSTLVAWRRAREGGDAVTQAIIGGVSLVASSILPIALARALRWGGAIIPSILLFIAGLIALIAVASTGQKH